MRPYLFIALIMFLFAPLLVTAQKVRLEDGSLDALKGIKKLNVKYEYSGMTVGKKSDKEYANDKKADYNKKEQGKGDKWEKAWIDDRTSRFEPRFEEEFEKQSDINIGAHPHEQYTLIFKTTRTEPGFNIGVARKNASIDGEARIVETANPSHIIATISASNCPGRTFFGEDYDTGERLQEAYAMAGKAIGRFISKEL